MKENGRDNAAYRRSVIAILSVFGACNCLGSIDGALGKIADYLAVDPTTALYVGSIPAITTMLASMTLGMAAGSRIRYRHMTWIGSVLLLAGGLIPVVVRSFALLLVFRGIFGFGAGALLSIENPLATILITDDARRARILGYGTSVGFGCQMVLQLIGGVLADVQWNYVFLTHLLLLVPVLLLLRYTPDIPLAEAGPKEEKRSGVRVPVPAVLICIMMGINGIMICPLLLGSAFYVGAITDSAKVAAVIAVMFSLGNMLGGMVYPEIHKRLGDWGYPVYLMIMASGIFISASAKTIPVMAFGFLFGGTGNACQIPAVMFKIGQICNREQLGKASSFMIMMMYLGMFLCSSWESAVGKITGDYLYMPLYLGSGVIALFAVVFLVLAIRSSGKKTAS